MLGRRPLFRNRNLRAENLGQSVYAFIRKNLWFTFFVIGVLIFTIIAATYEPEDRVFRPPSTSTILFKEKVSSPPPPSFKSDDALVKTGEDLVASNQTAFEPFINVTDVESAVTGENDEVIREKTECGVDDPVNCGDPDLFLLLMTTAMDHFRNLHFYRFGKPVPGNNASSCHMAWRFRPKEGKEAAFYKDYREFTLKRMENCTIVVAGIGEYHSGPNARKRKGRSRGKNIDNDKEVFEKMRSNVDAHPVALPEVGETVNDALPAVDSEISFSQEKYLIYSVGGDRCTNMNQYLWSFHCMLGEAQYLNRTLVIDLNVCLSKIYTTTSQDEENKDFRFYFDFEHLIDSASVLDQVQFWSEWKKWQQKDGLSLHVVEDVKVTPMKLAEIKDTVIMRKFGSNNYWYQVCEGEAESVISRPWHFIWKSRRLLDIASAIAARLNWDFDAVHVERGEKAKDKQRWPNLDTDTSPEGLLSTLKHKIDDGRDLYIATTEPNRSFFDPLKDKYTTHFVDDYKDLWDSQSDWYDEMKRLNNGNPVEFDGYMRVSVDTEVFLRAKKQIETFNDLTKDCKDGINMCKSSD